MAVASLDGEGVLMDKLPLLQNSIKRDPEAYVDEFRLQHRHFLAQLRLLELNPSQDAETFCALAQFLAHVAPCFPKDLAELPDQLLNLLKTHARALHAETRRVVAQSLMLLRSRNMIPPVPLLPTCLNLLAVPDKPLRTLLSAFVVHDVRSIHRSGRQPRLNRALIAVIEARLRAADENPSATRRSLGILVDLYRRRIWVDERAVNVIAQACLCKPTRVAVAGARFFLGVADEDGEEEEDSDVDDDEDAAAGAMSVVSGRHSKAVKGRTPAGGGSGSGPSVPDGMLPHQHSKKTRKRKRRIERAASAARLSRSRTDPSTQAEQAMLAMTPALDMLHDPHGLAEGLLKRVRSSKDRFEVRLLLLNLCTRLVGHHQLMLPPLYSFLARYLQPHQRGVTHLLAYLAQATHPLVPPSDLLPVGRAIADAFVAERSPGEAMAVGISALRTLCQRQPLLLQEAALRPIVEELVQLRRETRDRSVSAAARAFVNLVRETSPELLRGRDRGRFAQLGRAPLVYGERSSGRAGAGLEGVELLEVLGLLDEQVQAGKGKSKGSRGEDGDEDDDDGEVAKEGGGSKGASSASAAASKGRSMQGVMAEAMPSSGTGAKGTSGTQGEGDDDDDEDEDEEDDVKFEIIGASSSSSSSAAASSSSSSSSASAGAIKEDWSSKGGRGKHKHREGSGVDTSREDEEAEGKEARLEGYGSDDEEEDWAIVREAVGMQEEDMFDDEDEDEDEEEEEQAEAEGGDEAEEEETSQAQGGAAAAEEEASGSAAMEDGEGGEDKEEAEAKPLPDPSAAQSIVSRRPLSQREIMRLRMLRRLALQAHAQATGMQAAAERAERRAAKFAGRRGKRASDSNGASQSLSRMVKGVDVGQAMARLARAIRESQAARGAAGTDAVDADDTDDEGAAAGAATVDPRALESDRARKKRRILMRSERLERDKKEAAAERTGARARAGGSTNTEKRRKKNFMMVTKSRGVYDKIRGQLDEQHKAVKKHIRHLKNVGKQTTRKRRRA